MAKKPAETPAKPVAEATASPRDRAVKALMALAAEDRWDAITLPMIAAKADMSLAALRDIAPSKGALLGSFAKMIDQQILEQVQNDMLDEPVRDRLLDVMLRRFDALRPYREAIRNIRKHVSRDPLSLVALNSVALNSWRYMLAAADIDTEDDLGMVRVQGAAIVFNRALDTWLDEDDEGLTRTMAVLDKELKRGETIMRRFDDIHRLTAPFRGFARAVMEGRANRRAERRSSGSETPKPDEAPMQF